jgi:hypothetical protein
MKALPFIIFLSIISTGCSHRDPIDRIVKEESSNQDFPSGMFMPIRLPATASAAELASRALGFEQLATNCTVLETRQVRIHEDSPLPPELIKYTAVLVDTTSGRKVILLQFQQYTKHTNSLPGGWWSRVYDVK